MLLRCLLLTAFAMCPALTQAQEIGSFERPVVPTQTIELLNGKDLNGFYTWLTDGGHEDPRQVFTVQPDGTLRISGDGFGGLITRQSYSKYHLVMEYRWGTVTWAPRKEKARDGGLLLHAYGPDGGFGGTKDKPGPWMTSIEFQIIEGGVGDILVLQGLDEKGNRLEAACTAEVQKDRDGENCWKAGGDKQRFTKGRINWFGRDPDWKDTVGFRGKDDPDSPGQEWTRLDCYATGDSLTYLVNGTLVNRVTEVTPNRGKILLQTEGAEMFVRKFELRPLPEKLP
ncbi:hypothetical protein Pan44_31690 [Caulifigura coniformis]|uniref:3-keto-alpha-glucoside-1,2-lyase/3-keto-2-hydroxy-glucal hydratase domain-containing protein n=1 Tax=Caulifigura coniformis TaxID=2527983 RepID=A0A517SGB9_9PLAN|nr:DUF1080 domain-containing protein [Caulifigura coniformis]QDT55127.1 hypothetical protein Pan44_31690 [Caulifigura coniformis]